MEEKHPKANKLTLANIWRYKDFFVTKNQDHVALRGLMDLPTMVAAFEATPYIEVGPAAPHPGGNATQPSLSAPPQPLQLPFAPTACHSSKASRSSDDSSINSSDSGLGPWL
jgi:hypothetical protein